MIKKFVAILIIFTLFMSFGCVHRASRVPSARSSKDPLFEAEKIADSKLADEYVKKGDKLFKDGNLEQALKEFNAAKDIDPEYSPAYLGLSLVYERENNTKKSIENLDSAQEYIKKRLLDSNFYIMFMKHYMSLKDETDMIWLKAIQLAFYEAQSKMPESPEPYFFMAKAYKKVYKLSDAKALFTKVSDLNREYSSDALAEIKEIQEIEQKRSHEVVPKVVFLSAIRRGDVASLFVKELDIERLFKKIDQYKDQIADIKKHPSKSDIELLLAIGIKGLELFKDNIFEPNLPINRGEFALMIEDIILKVTGDESLNNAFANYESPFIDMLNNHRFFNAAMLCTTRNIMSTTVSGAFNPQGAVSGADALLSIRTLKKLLENYYK